MRESRLARVVVRADVPADDLERPRPFREFVLPGGFPGAAVVLFGFAVLRSFFEVLLVRVGWVVTFLAGRGREVFS